MEQEMVQRSDENRLRRCQRERAFPLGVAEREGGEDRPPRLETLDMGDFRPAYFYAPAYGYRDGGGYDDGSAAWDAAHVRAGKRNKSRLQAHPAAQRRHQARIDLS